MKRIFIAFILLVACYSFPVQGQTTQKWSSFVQTIDASFLKRKVKFKMSASVKVETNDDKASAALWVRVDGKNGQTQFFNNMNDRKIKSNEWKVYTIEGTMDENSDKINLGGLFYYNGKFYYDNFELLVENSKGEFQPALLRNSDFEIPFEDGKIPNWVQGIKEDAPVKIKGFSFSPSDDKAHGSHALLIEGNDIQKDTTSLIGPVKGYTPQIGTLVTMLNNLSLRVERAVETLDPKDVDKLLDENANSIGALVMHLAAAEVFFQVLTFEHRRFNDEEKEKWQDAFELGEKARKKFKGKDISYYLEQYKNVRKKTLEELAKRNDEWLAMVEPGGDYNNHYFWFHVMEHQSSHLGQILLLKKRLPKKDKKIEEKIDIGK